MNRFLFLAGVFGCVTSTGCVANTDEPDEETAVSEISVAGGATWSSQTDKKLGPTATQTCFLTGVTGQFAGTANSSQHGFRPAIVSVQPRSGSWWIHVDKALGTGVQARVMCINTPYDPSLEISWSDNQGDSLPDAPHRHCMLREVWSTGGLDGSKLPEIGNEIVTNISVALADGEWSMNGSYVHEASLAGNWGYGGGTAVCFDHAGFALGQSFSGGPFGVLPFQIGSGLSVTDNACGFTKVQGNFNSSTYGLLDGALMDNDPADGSTWTIGIAANKTARVACVR